MAYKHYQYLADNFPERIKKAKIEVKLKETVENTNTTALIFSKKINALSKKRDYRK